MPPKQRPDSPHSKTVSFGADEKEDAEIRVQAAETRKSKMLMFRTAAFQRRSVMVFSARKNEEDERFMPNTKTKLRSSWGTGAALVFRTMYPSLPKRHLIIANLQKPAQRSRSATS